MSIFNKIFKSYSEKEVKRIMPIVDKINSLEDEISKLTDEELKNKTNEFKEQLDNGKTLDDILPEAFAVVREASKRVLGMRHFDVQLIGGIILHQGRIAEMKTGEGKTLVATLPVYLNALTGRGVHVITVNDYLAKRDSEWMGKLYKFMGLSVGLVIAGMDPKAKQKAYACDITYGTNNEFGFDYLRDNMVIYKEQLVQRDLAYAIVDEIDSILIDEARTPLIISGRANQSSDLYKKANDFVKRLTPKVIVEEDVKDEAQAEDNENYDYIVDLKAKSASLTQKGIKKAEEAFHLENFNDIENSTLVHHVNQALRAHGVMKKDIDYIVKDGEVLIVDEFTGRIMYGRRYNNGLHQAIEAKEGVKIADESKTLATITFQNYFRMYDKLSGMTGTAMTEEAEFEEIYNLDVISIPTNKPMIRKDLNDAIYKNEKAKFNAIVQSVKESHEKGQPVLIGTAVVGATTMIFSLILVIKETLGIQPEMILNLLNPYTLLGFIAGGAVIYWFSGASMQAVTTGAYSATEFIKNNIKLGEADDKCANLANSKEVVKICTQYAQKGMYNIFIALFGFALALACLSAPVGDNAAPVSFFVSYLIAIAVFGLFQAVFMANAGGCWDNAKKIVEVDMNEKGTELHAATVVGDTVGDPFKDTSSVAMNPIIKFTTLFGLLAMEIAINPAFKAHAKIAGAVILVIALVYVIRSFYAMRIPAKKKD